MSRIKDRGKALALGAFLSLALWGPAAFAGPSSDDTASRIRVILSDGKAPDLDLADIDLKSLREFYAKTVYAPVWLGDAKETGTMLAALDHAAEDGLDPAQYHVGDDLLRRPAAAPLQAAEFDVLLTDAALKFARDLRKGRPETRAIDRDVDLPEDAFDPSNALADALRADALDMFLAHLAPPHPEYAGLKAALERYRAIAAGGDWPQLPSVRAERFADDSALSTLLRRRLAYEDASAGSDADLAEAVKRFQQRHGLDPDGRVGPQTLAALNVPASERAGEIVANMERWRWVPRAFEKSYVVVNVPDAHLDIVADGKILLTSSVIVGRTRGPTPIMRAVATAITINPPWNVPASIARREILPKLQRDPSYLAAQNMVLVNGPADDPSGVHIDWKSISATHFPYSVRQLPGPTNALGQIKLELPNRFAVYLHDTPAKGAFDLNERYLSHGCVRVEKIRELASYALTGDVASAARQLDAAVAAGTTEHLALDAPLPIYLLYWTAFVDDDGTIEFRRDIYGRDRRFLDFIEKRAQRQQVTFNVPQCLPA